ncbi:HD-GYP domain-containing protein [Lutispora saccharofermentans]|uniref:HD-GYP domain-containing protein n=1 Tax=Lutispora saccharofermentans TaxID=3024236 RepID=A0ABT1NEM9_9FIRM|nr:HD-GYP domain-containing protein [Lutispora saccharofermentans]MCQ1528633.1 HD-GYP domain-containing protein [Lutispora saccharofermentans]
MPRKLKYYVSFIIVLGVLFTVLTFNRLDVLDLKTILFFLVLSIAAESLLIPTSNQRGISVGFAVSLTVLLILGIPQATWIPSLGVMFRVASKDGKRYHIFNTPIYKTLFNGANIVLSSGLAGLCYEALGGIPGQLEFINILPMLASIVVYIIVNALIMSILMTILSGDNFYKMLYTNMIWVIKDYLALAPLGIIMAIAYINYKILGVLLFFGPLLLARYSFKMYVDMRSMYLDTVKALCQAVEAKDPYTQGHSQRVSELAYKLGQRMRLSHKTTENLKLAGMLHDIGKIGVDEHILNKPGRLTDDEYGKIKLHPAIGSRIIQEIDFLKATADIILSHHEHFDGSGYPNGKRKSEISIESCILCVVDVYDALTSDRPYRNAMTDEEAMEIIKRESGTLFNPIVAQEFMNMMGHKGEVEKVAG